MIGFVELLVVVVWLGLVVYLLVLASRLVNAVERIARKLDG